MSVEFHLLISATLFGIGIGSALSRRNVISIIMAICTAGMGALIAVAAIDHAWARDNDGMMFALGLGTILLAWVVLGGVLAYRRYTATKSTEIDDENRLRH